VKFFDPYGNQITPHQWLNTYERYYFLDGPTYRNRITRRNQTSRFVEDRVVALLEKEPLEEDDLILVMAWKLGAIDQQASEQVKKIIYQNSWGTNPTRPRYGGELSSSIEFLVNDMTSILRNIRDGNAQAVFDLHKRLNNFGPVYILTILFFALHGVQPIYDQFVHKAATALAPNL
jgi:hypothetical protein